MIRTCIWCGDEYDTNNGSSMYCESNPNYMYNKEHRKMKRKKSSIIKIGAYVLSQRQFPK